MRAIPAHYKTPSTDGEDDNPILRVTSRIPLSSVGCPDVSGAVSGALCLLPEGANVGVPADAAILRHKGRSMMSGGGHDELVGRIARKRWRQSTALNEYRPRQLGQVQALHGGRHVEPFVEWPIELDLMLLVFATSSRVLRLARQLREAVAVGVDGEVQPVADARLLENDGEVIAHRLLADVEPLGDLV